MRIVLVLLLSLCLFSCKEKDLAKTVKAQVGLKENQRRMPAGEFRAAWVATVRNMDWPSQPGLSAAAQQREAIKLLDRAVAPQVKRCYFSGSPRTVTLSTDQVLSLGVVIFQEFKEEIQAMILSNSGSQKLTKEVWSYTPWFNPFRMRHPNMKGDYSEKSIAKRRPHWGYELKKGYAWLDPGRKDVQDFSMEVIMDVVNRYDVDGIHLDDYFYPYPEFTKNGFPDSKTYALYRRNGGTLGLDDWRRENINTFVKNLGH